MQSKLLPELIGASPTMLSASTTGENAMNVPPQHDAQDAFVSGTYVGEFVIVNPVSRSRFEPQTKQTELQQGFPGEFFLQGIMRGNPPK